MLVRERMTANPIVVTPDTSFEDALQLLREKKIRRLPVVDKNGNLVGIVVEKDLLYASPSPATSLSVFEIHSLLAKLKIKDVMTKRVITVGEDCPLEEAARIMVEHKIGSLPILRDRKVVGIITETDIFKVMTEALGGSCTQCVRATVRVPEEKGALAQLAGEIAKLGGNIVSVVTFGMSDASHRELTLKVVGLKRDEMQGVCDRSNAQVIDLRESGTPYQPLLVSSR
jgi:acetoin utilization protein AcuB